MNPVLGAFALLRAGFVLAREGVIAALPAEGLPPAGRFAHRVASVIARPSADSRARSERLSRALNRLGPSYVKLGQFLATRPDIVGQEIARELEQLQDKVPPFPHAEAVKEIESSLGRSMGDLFLEFGGVVGAASIAQVHRAVVATPDGPRTVAVKVIRPGIRARFRRDLRVFYFAAHTAERLVVGLRRLRPVAIVDTLAQSTKIEMDLRLEAAAFSEMAENTAEDPDFRVPGVDWERTGRDVLTMDWVEGIKLNNVPAVAAAGHDLPKLGITVVQSFLRHSMRDGFFHADMHPGNLFVAPDGAVVAVDLGIVGRLGPKERRFLAEILYGFIRRDYTRVAEVHFEAGYVPRRHDVASFAQAIRAIGEPIHGQSAETISMAHLLTLLFEVTELFDMQTRPELILLQKTMVVVEGVARSFDPRFNMWEAAEPVVADYIRGQLGPAAALRDAREDFSAFRRILAALPQAADGFEILVKALPDLIENGVRIDDDALTHLATEKRASIISGRIAQWVIALSLASIALTMLWR
ncbi:2-polyprenylphenol 6-hydroxylase [Mangrovibrevibacter kandeliae]|uniref:2-polyprenylphenol 6-hydroxylase n=1 Tax=Mangrovibrevibacter kandeliae TaxID=2968473 RepID=UPI0021174338|nr:MULTISPECIES: 2-polyprenylphenol 6-hydroxylase [unclassified Aurantimonas]MCQ8783002.1 2-polyprenylphenol 6-hydroxylase [Aurantimonas sp. CSK15Z-1]MCW4115806.1 2-polyprenylphenol 6-hydroxylase [Aurantimonas sp. MSK8Z-1]